MSAGNGPSNNSNQYNSAGAGGNVYATQGGGTINVHPPQAAARRGVGIDTKVLLAVIVADVAFFFIGMLSYTGENTSGDTWRAGIFLFLLALTGTLIRRWIPPPGVITEQGVSGTIPRTRRQPPRRH